MSLETSQINELHWLMEMLHTIDVGLVVLDRDYKVQIWNGFMENHSGLLPREVKDKVLFPLFDEIPEAWFKRKAESVFLLKNKAFTIWEQRPYLFKFQNYRPITGAADYMYQNTTFIPLMSATGVVTHLCLIIYDVTDNASHKKDLVQANKELAILSQTDGLTKLFNRTHWEHCLQAEYKRWIRSQNPSCLVMIDIDNFKVVNDTYGHVVGDEVIRHISGLIRHHVRETDVSGRYGGEEFVILLADTTLDNGKVFAERLREEIEKSIVKYNDIDVKYTVSMGIAEIDTSIESYEAWIECSDLAMYRAKDAGRNQIALHTNPIA
ncbi:MULTISPECIES: sensor domain-containing diguanylate cyclase [unclassified Colwellia]|uniref:sensor domain-containing diguanylate cyclase n=1 Tax=unclassified Colwellia TaxID=196834 RepID=UPI0015F3C315|nr:MULTISPECIES: diguanylate cyclase [unclassified Colwellia]MBA6230983.1 diguanylate cyclase [Colwellia sp. MB02u-7]MBA6234914.1 diguanylate cyclase [Colwellia sp. MB02u-11]MBA6255778.1 diguanylate cyclase [Colwellia sp. MB3u-28]MBA6261919.1 diguanylate cyclase [Colwellia sp. MB3u-41]MBA6301469.1 diguanylate cyclase [Colwellia sp. MB3u-22]